MPKRECSYRRILCARTADVRAREGLGHRGGAMQDLGYELPRMPKRRSSQNSISTSLGEYEAHHLDNTFRNGETENKTWVHIPVFLFANKTIITFCKAVVTATAQATPTGP